MKKRIIGIGVITMIMFLMTACGEASNKKLLEKIDSIETKLEEQEKQEELQKQLDKANAEISSLKQQLDGEDSSNYVAIKFWQDGKTYKPYDEEFKFYADQYCSKQITEVTIISPIYDEVELENEITVYAMLSNKGIIWSSDYPRLDEIE